MNARSCAIRFVDPNQVDEVLRYYQETDDENNIGRGAEELKRAAQDFLLLGVYDGEKLSGVAGAFWLPEEDDALSQNHLELGGTHLLETMQRVGLQKRILIPLRLASAIVLHPPEEGLWSAVKPDNIASRNSVEYNGFEKSTDPPESLYTVCGVQDASRWRERPALLLRHVDTPPGGCQAGDEATSADGGRRWASTTRKERQGVDPRLRHDTRRDAGCAPRGFTGFHPRPVDTTAVAVNGVVCGDSRVLRAPRAPLSTSAMNSSTDANFN